MANPFSYHELHTEQPDKAKAFYRQLFDWQVKDLETPMGAYTEIAAGEAPAGLKKMKDALPSPQWVTYMLVDDVALSTKKAKDLGGKPIRELQEVPGEGTYSLLADPTGAVFGLWQPVKR
jgi:predicted enzyme related to lactoylglutathione lyase